MPIITLRIPVHELLATLRQAAAEGRDVRAELVQFVLGGAENNAEYN